MEHTINAEKKPMGRIATEIAVLLQGKRSPAYNPKDASGVRVVVKNISKMVVSGKKFDKKIYYHHTGYMGHLREQTYKESFTKSPKETLRRAVYSMLPKNRLRQVRLNKLFLYDTEN